jgi:hypothetical protein
LQLQFRTVEHEPGVECLDRRSEKRQRIAGRDELANEFVLSFRHVAVDRHFAREISRAPAEQPRQFTEVSDCSRDVAAKFRQVSSRARQSQFAAQGQLVAALFEIELLDLNLPAVERRAEHNRFGGPIAPGQPRDFQPDGSSRVCEIARAATEGELAGMDRAAGAGREIERVRHSRERNLSRGCRNVPVPLIAFVFDRHAGAQLAAEGVERRINPDLLLSQPREIEREHVEIEAVHERDGRDCKAVLLP